MVRAPRNTSPRSTRPTCRFKSKYRSPVLFVACPLQARPRPTLQFFSLQPAVGLQAAQIPTHDDYPALPNKLLHHCTKMAPRLPTERTGAAINIGALRGTPGSACPQPEPNATELPSFSMSCAKTAAAAVVARRGGHAPPGPRRSIPAQRPVARPPQRPPQLPAPRP